MESREGSTVDGHVQDLGTAGIARCLSGEAVGRESEHYKEDELGGRGCRPAGDRGDSEDWRWRVDSPMQPMRQAELCVHALMHGMPRAPSLCSSS